MMHPTAEVSEQVTAALLGTRFYNFQPLTPTMHPQTPHLLHHRRLCHMANQVKHIYTSIT